MLQNIREWIALAELKGLGIRNKHKLLGQFNFQPDVLFRLADSKLALYNLPAVALSQISEYRQGRWPDPAYLGAIEVWLQQPQHSLIALTDPDYPALLKTISDPPLLLYIWGDTSVLHMPQLAIVGSRSATRQGLNLSNDFSRSLTEAGLVVTSGLARGVDGAAHSGAVGLLKPTVAVLGSGLQQVYPRQHQALAQEIVACGGALVSELPLQMAPLAHNFPRRNRIISGLSAGVLVVEATERSGSLITARIALEQGREVFALPGAINNPQSHGCHRLIRQGATLVETVEHVIEQLSTLLGSYQQEELTHSPESIKLTTDEAWLLDQIGFQLIALEQLIAETGLDAAELMPRLVAMELNGYIEKTADGYQRLI